MLSDCIIQEARSWINTPFHLQGRKKHIGVDCVGLIIEVNNSMPEHFQPILNTKTNYNLTSNELEDHMNTLLIKADSPEATIGSIAFFQNGNYSHCGIIGTYKNNKTIIHACLSTEKVVEHRMLNIKPKSIYNFKRI